MVKFYIQMTRSLLVPGVYEEEYATVAFSCSVNQVPVCFGAIFCVLFTHVCTRAPFRPIVQRRRLDPDGMSSFHSLHAAQIPQHRYIHSLNPRLSFHFYNG